MRTVAVFGLVVLFAGCTAGRVATWEKQVDLSKKGDDSALIRSGADAFAGRGEEANLRRALQQWEQAAALNPGNADTHVKLARGYYLLADGFLSFEAESSDAKKQEMLKTYENGVQAGERALIVLSPDFRRKVQAGTKVKDAIVVLSKEAAPALYWYAVNLGKWARAKGFTTALFWKDTAKSAVERVLELDRNYWFAGADRYFGAFYAYLPGIAGGDEKKARVHFEKALEIAPNYLGTKVLMAELYYVKKKRSREMFEKTLNEVVKANPDAIPEVAPEQRIEQKKAAKLLKNVEEYF